MSALSDRHRYRNTLLTAHLGWWGTAAVVAGRALEIIPQQLGTTALLTLGLGVTASLSLSRMRLGETVTQVFQAGMKAAITLSANVFTDTCILALDEDGMIVSVDHSDAIGWEPEAILGQKLKDLLCPRSHRMPIRHLEPGTSITSPMRNQEGGTFDARISLASLNQNVDQHDGQPETSHHLVATISPVVTPTGSLDINH